MVPNSEYIKILNNLELLEEFIGDLIIFPKQILHKWAVITHQTPAVKLGYLGQHIASLITGVQGTSTGARGDDLADGTEVKSCNKIDQADKCKVCGHRVMRFEKTCPHCQSSSIDRKNDSKWLFSVRDEYELQQYLQLNRILLIVMDYPNFLERKFNDIRISSFEIYPREERMHVFCDLIKNHYYNIYLPKLRNNQKTNPMNLHPYSFQFYMCNPIQTFSCIIKDIDTSPEVQIEKYLEPSVERDEQVPSLLMPSSLLKSNAREWDTLAEKADFDNEIKPFLTKELSKNQFTRLADKEKIQVLPFINEKLRSYLSLREIISVTQSVHYHRR